MKNLKKYPVGFKGTREWMGSASIIMRFGVTLALSIVVFFLIGYKLDKWLETKGVFTVILTLYGIIGGAGYIYRHVMKMIKDEEKDKPVK